MTNRQLNFLVNYADTCIFNIYFKILPVGSIVLIPYTLITVCCEAPQTIMDLALYEVKYNYIIIKLKQFLRS